MIIAPNLPAKRLGTLEGDADTLDLKDANVLVDALAK
jgi:hypothetical protein